MLTLLAAAMLLTAPGVPPYNLDCTGLLTEWSDLEGVRREKPFAATYHLDPGRRVWCQDACQDARRIIANDGGQIVLLRSTEPGALQSLTIGQADDRLRSIAALDPGLGLGSLHVEIDATCQRAEYTPVPRGRPRRD